MNPKKKKLLLQLAISAVLLLTAYFVGVYAFSVPMEIPYVVAGTTLGLYYVIYNRGFSRRNVTPDMLPDTMSVEEKQAFIEDGKRRSERSRWVLIVLLPMIFALIIDLAILFVVPTVKEALL